jgi:hypothetical protein
MAYTPAPFNPSTPYQNQVATELNLANQNFTILSQAFLNNDPASKPILRASHIGSTAPSNPVAGTTWLDTSTNPPTLKVYDGSNWQSNVINANNSNTVNNFSASQTPSANTIPVSDNTGKIADGWLNFVANDPKVKTALNASGDAPIYTCRAWVNFNGTTSPPTIKASGNVSSVVLSATGSYTVNFIANLPSTNYIVCGSAAGVTSVSFNTYVSYNLSYVNVNSCLVETHSVNVSSSGGLFNSPDVRVAFIGG